jgi:prophage regulatory protein
MAARLIRRNRVLEKSGFGTTTLYKLMNLGLFPRPVPLTPSGQIVGWVEDEVDDYNARVIAAARNSTSPK